MRRSITFILMATLIVAVVLTGGCIEEAEDKPPEATTSNIFTFAPRGFGLENITQKYALTVWEKIKGFGDAKFVTSEKSYSAIVFVHPYTVGGFDPSTAEWIVVISSTPEMIKEVKIAIFRLDYRTFDLKKSYKFSYPARKELTLEESMAIMEKDRYGNKFVEREKITPLGGNYIYSYPAVDFGGTIIINKYAGMVIYYATTVWDGKGKLIIPEEVDPSIEP